MAHTHTYNIPIRSTLGGLAGSLMFLNQKNSLLSKPGLEQLKKAVDPISTVKLRGATSRKF